LRRGNKVGAWHAQVNGDHHRDGRAAERGRLQARVPRSLLKVGFILLRVWAILDEMSRLPTVEALIGGTGNSRETSTRGTRLIGRSGGSSGTNKDRMLEWI
jgi:hypothetical protein